ncbi:hypothetical protein [Aliivibrio fischeri]|uniref:Uncharacterized protein n=1 Tax=Aliivibrio fischeri TaxID=668 RepID=A0A510UM40_ALIFS|nr:hypothetical protein [Aliivibrio fischeri]GEK15733.1 hypothetical protein AFI02nite_37690 [Aliivibrio fischeri]
MPKKNMMVVFGGFFILMLLAVFVSKDICYLDASLFSVLKVSAEFAYEVKK